MIEEQILNSFLSMGETGLFFVGCIMVIKHLAKEKQDNIVKQDNIQKEMMEQLKVDNKRREEMYTNILTDLRADSKIREEKLIESLNGMSHLIENTLADFTNTLNNVNGSMIEVSTQLGHLGTEFHREIVNVSQRMGDIEHGIDRVNEKLGLPPIQKK